jgi:biopolymer transport protein ExbD
MQFGKRPRPNVAINISPLVDVVFLLVIFFAVSTTFLETAGLKLELPESNSTARQESKQLTVFLDADGGLSFEGESIEPDALAERLSSELDARESKRVALRADASSRHGDVVKVMDLIRGAGADGLTVVARPVEAP